MGLSFSLRNANLVGHLIDGKVKKFLDEGASQGEIFEGNVDFISTLIREDPTDGQAARVFFTTKTFLHEVEADLVWLRSRWPKVSELWSATIDDLSWEDDPIRRRELLNFFTVVSGLLSRCKLKALLLPGFLDTPINRAFRSKELLSQLVEIHPGSSALILQINEPLLDDDKTVLGIFSQFQKAYDKIDEWPGVLFWNKQNAYFIRVETQEGLVRLFVELREAKSLSQYLAKQSRLQEKKHLYFFHLSDLHFGSSNNEARVRRLTRILRDRIRTLVGSLGAIPLITGDIMDSPTTANRDSFRRFRDSLMDFGFRKPIMIPGNHDLRWMGIDHTFRDAKAASYGIADDPITVLDEFDVGFLRFNSSEGGNWASGEIGESQLIEMTARLNELDNPEITFLALLHHHPLPIDDPYWYRKPWYERVIPPSARNITQRLNDAERFLAWLRSKHIKYALHGHKHIPAVRFDHTQEVNVIGAGSATGRVEHIEPWKTYLSYNLLKFDIDQGKVVSCAIVAEEVIDTGTTDIWYHF